MTTRAPIRPGAADVEALEQLAALPLDEIKAMQQHYQTAADLLRTIAREKSAIARRAARQAAANAAAQD